MKTLISIVIIIIILIKMKKLLETNKIVWTNKNQLQYVI